eukprot:42038-Rhodomonas_salina.1
MVRLRVLVHRRARGLEPAPPPRYHPRRVPRTSHARSAARNGGGREVGRAWAYSCPWPAAPRASPPRTNTCRTHGAHISQYKSSTLKSRRGPTETTGELM